MPKKILLIEDDVTLRDLYSERLKMEGYDILIATEGPEGVEKAMSDHPDAIMLDLRIPKLDGFGVLEKLKANNATKNIPVLVLSALAEKEAGERVMKLGAAGFLNKADTMPAKVVEKIKELLE